MKKENKCYIFYLEGNEHSHPTIVLKNKENELFTENIEDALKASNNTTAKYILRDYEDRYDSGEINKCSNYDLPERGLKTIPLKITYEW